jgi:hypothetical protein
VERGSRFCLATIELEANSDQQHCWPLHETLGATTVRVEDLADLFGDDVPRGPWSDPPRQALILPLRASIAHPAAGFLIAGVSARLKLDDAYRDFYSAIRSRSPSPMPAPTRRSASAPKRSPSSIAPKPIFSRM